MANNPKKVKDPTEVALSAIQEALNISDAPPADNTRGSMRSDAGSSDASAPSYNDSFDTRPSADRQIFEPIEEPRSARRAANDDRETIGQILQAIQKGRPARNVYTLATLFAGVWMIGCAPSDLQLPARRCRRRSARAPAARWCWPALRPCSSRRCCCSTSWRAWPGAARNCA